MIASSSAENQALIGATENEASRAPPTIAAECVIAKKFSPLTTMPLPTFQWNPTRGTSG